MEFDQEELIKQEMEEAMKSGKFLHVETVVPEIEGKTTTPISLITGNGNTAMAYVLCECLRKIQDDLVKKDPGILVYGLTNNIKTNVHVIENKKRKEEEQ